MTCSIEPTLSKWLNFPCWLLEDRSIQTTKLCSLKACTCALYVCKQTWLCLDSSRTCHNTVKVGWKLLEGWNCAARCAALQRKRLGVITVKHCYSVIFGSATGEGEGRDRQGEKNGTDDVAKTWASCSKMTRMTRVSDTVLVTFTPCWKNRGRRKKSHDAPAAITEGTRSLGRAPRPSDVHWLQDKRLQKKVHSSQHCREQLCRARDIIKETFQMPLDSEVEAN